MSSCVHIVPHHNNRSSISFPGVEHSVSHQDSRFGQSQSDHATSQGQRQIGNESIDPWTSWHTGTEVNFNERQVDTGSVMVSPSVLSAWFYRASTTSSSLARLDSETIQRNWTDPKSCTATIDHNGYDRSGTKFDQSGTPHTTSENKLPKLGLTDGDLNGISSKCDLMFSTNGSVQEESSRTNRCINIDLDGVKEAFSFSSGLPASSTTSAYPSIVTSIPSIPLNRWNRNDSFETQLNNTQHGTTIHVGSNYSNVYDKTRNPLFSKVITSQSNSSKRQDGKSNLSKGSALHSMVSVNESVNHLSAVAGLARSSYMCRKCRAHGKLLPVKQHKRNCPFRNCSCTVCSLVNYGRHIVAKQIALYRDQKNHSQSTTERSTRHSNEYENTFVHAELTPIDSVVSGFSKQSRTRRRQPVCSEYTSEVDEGPHCRRCRNHGKNHPWKGHKKICPFRFCACQQCILISLRKSNEKNLREVVQEEQEDQTDKRFKVSLTKNTPTRVISKASTILTQTTVSNSSSLAETITTPQQPPTFVSSALQFPSFTINQAATATLFPYPYLTHLTDAYASGKFGQYLTSSSPQPLRLEQRVRPPLESTNNMMLFKPLLSQQFVQQSGTKITDDNSLPIFNQPSTGDPTNLESLTNLTQVSDIIRNNAVSFLNLPVNPSSTAGNEIWPRPDSMHINRNYNLGDSAVISSAESNTSGLFASSKTLRKFQHSFPEQINAHTDYDQGFQSTQPTQFNCSLFTGPQPESNRTADSTPIENHLGMNYRPEVSTHSSYAPTMWIDQTPHYFAGNRSSDKPSVSSLFSESNQEMVFRSLIETAACQAFTTDISNDQSHGQILASMSSTVSQPVEESYSKDIECLSGGDLTVINSNVQINPFDGNRDCQFAWGSQEYPNRAAAFAAAAAAAVALRNQHEQKTRTDCTLECNTIPTCSDLSHLRSVSKFTTGSESKDSAFISIDNRGAMNLPNLETPHSFSPRTQSFPVQLPLKREPYTSPDTFNEVHSNTAISDDPLIKSTHDAITDASNPNYDTLRYEIECPSLQHSSQNWPINCLVSNLWPITTKELSIDDRLVDSSVSVLIEKSRSKTPSIDQPTRYIPSLEASLPATESNSMVSTMAMPSLQPASEVDANYRKMHQLNRWSSDFEGLLVDETDATHSTDTGVSSQSTKWINEGFHCQ